jgi:ATP/maltotriose-dependent transcriptional regulator MalT
VTEAPAGRARAEVLIETKLHSPAARREWVERRELIGHLAGSAARLVLVDAPAGFGKTTLVAQWLVGISIWPTVEVLLRFAPVLAELGEHAAAVRLLDEARQLLRSLPDGAGAQLARLDRLERRLAALSPATALDEPLTDRERDVLRLLRGSMSLREIGQELYLSQNTIKTHTRAIYRKLGVSDRHTAVLKGRDLGFM